MTGKSSQRKGRGGEIEACNEIKPFGISARVHGMYEAFDMTIDGYPFEVKRQEKLSLRRANDAIEAGARGMVARLNRKPWTITVDFKDWLEDQAELKRLHDFADYDRRRLERRLLSSQ